MARRDRNGGGWPPLIPARLGRRLAAFTPYKGGWCRWYAGRSRHVCGRDTPLDQVEKRWDELRQRVDAEAHAARERAARGVSVREAAVEYYNWLDARVRLGRPRPMSLVTAQDYSRVLSHFARFVGADRPLRELKQEDFTRYARSFDANAASTLARVVSYVRAWLRWCVDEGVIEKLPPMGRTFVKPSAQALRDTRLSVQKSYTPEQLRALWSTADAELKAWLVLGLLGALDNADIAHLTHDVVDRERGVIDYRRRKVGRVRRVIPLPPEAWAILDAYQRPAPADPADKNRFFLTPTGKPLQRTRISARGQPHTIDYVAMRWRRLLERVGLKPRTPRRRPGQPATPRRFKPRGEPAGQGFRALRTTFANLAPPGYRDEVEIIMGHSRGSVLVEHYVEQVGIERLAYVTASLWRLLGAETKPQTQTTAEAA